MKAKIAKMSIAIASAALSLTGMLCADVSSILVGTGYRQDSLTSIVRERSNVNPRGKTNLHFRDVEIVLIDVKAKTTFGCCDTYARIDFDYGWVLDGKLREKLSLKNRHSDAEFCNDGFEESGWFHDVISRRDVSKNSFVWDLDLAFIYPIKCGCSQNWMFGPGIGFTVNRQQLHAKGDDFRHESHSSSSSSSYSDFSDYTSSSDSCDSGHRHHNRTSWWGPWIGFDFAYDSCDCWNLYGEVEFHIGRVRHNRNGHGDNEFGDGFKNTRSYCGPSIKLGSTYTICENWYLDGSVFYSKYFSFNSNRDNIKWATANIRLDIGYTF